MTGEDRAHPVPETPVDTPDVSPGDGAPRPGGDGTGAAPEAGRLLRNTGSLMAGRLAVAALSSTATVLIARQLGPHGFGQFTSIFSLLGMLSIVTDLGLGRVAVSGFARAGDDKASYAGSYLLLRAGLGVVGYLVALAWTLVAGYPAEVVAATAVGGLVVVFATPSSAYDLAFQIHNRLPLLAVAGFIGQLAQVALTVALVLHGGTLMWFMVPAVVNSGLVLMWMSRTAHRLMPIEYRIDVTVWKRLIREAAPLTVGAAFATLYYRIDSLMLASLDSFEAVGSYGVALKFADLVHFVSTAMTVALMAPLSTSWVEDRAAFAGHLRNGIRVLAVAAAAALGGFLLFASDLAHLFYGNEYADTGRAIRLLMGAESISFFSALATTALVAARCHRRYPLITFAGLVLNVGVNLVVIPHWSFEGAAGATLLTEACVGVLLWTQVLRTGVATTALAERSFVTGLLVTIAVAGGAGLGLGLVAPWFVAAAAYTVLFLIAVDRLALIGPGGLLAVIGSRRR